jgi:hypothetical protein
MIAVAGRKEFNEATAGALTMAKDRRRQRIHASPHQCRMREVMCALLDRDAALERWLREEVVADIRSISLIPLGEFLRMRSRLVSKHGGPHARLDKTLFRLSTSETGNTRPDPNLSHKSDF